jgi:thioesterase domain-containing protein/NRPS condensation-like uncharacterized protein/acyl carrier protein
MQKPKIEAILPLTFMQQALLFHSLSGHQDQGFLHVKCILSGDDLNKNIFQEAWSRVVKRHEALRTSIHWEKIEKPLQVIHHDASIPWHFEDLSNLTESEQHNHLIEFKEKDQKEGLKLTKAPVSRLALFQLEKDKHLLLWSCHHILLDGWSASNIIKDVFTFYEAAVEDKRPVLEPVPSFKAYLKELQSLDETSARESWVKAMEGFDDPSLVSPSIFSEPVKKKSEYTTLIIPSAINIRLKEYARQNRLTLNTLIQGIWALLLSAYADKKDVAFGTTVSVRSEHLENAEQMAGLFTNMLPIRIQVPKSLSLTAWLSNIQNEQTKVRNYQQVTLDQIISWIDWPGYLPVFDHLLVLENFPWDAFTRGNITVSDFGSGITTTYPLTIIVKPLEELEFTFQYDPNAILKPQLDWLSSNLETLINAVITNPQYTINEILHTLQPTEKINTLNGQLKKQGKNTTQSKSPEAIVQPDNPMELKLSVIWADIFGRSDIGVTDNFFEIGGKSIIAVRLFAQIDTQLGFNLPPISLLQYPTIRDLAGLIGQGENNIRWKSLVPIRTKGNRPPLFCLHAKGGHVFFYNAMASYLDDDQPVYALQPKGLDGIESMYNSIEEMAKHYIEEIRSIQPQGPYVLLATCFSNAVGLEMAQQLKKAGQSISALFMVDAPPGDQLIFKDTKKPSILKRVTHNIQHHSVLDISKKAMRKLNKIKLKLVNPEQSKQEENLLKVQQTLNNIFNKYQRKFYDGKITLIRSGEFDKRQDKIFHIEGWLKIVSKDNLEIIVVPGHHESIFDEPEVQHLAQKIKECLTIAQNSFSE